MTGTILFVSLISALVVLQCFCEDITNTSTLNAIETSDSKDIIRNADDIIALMRRKSKKYLEQVGDKWIIGEKFNQQQIDCLLHRGKCLKDMEVIKATLISALRNGCDGCTDDNKRTAGDALLVLLSRQPEVWRTFIKIFRQDYPDTHSLKDFL